MRTGPPLGFGLRIWYVATRPASASTWSFNPFVLHSPSPLAAELLKGSEDGEKNESAVPQTLMPLPSKVAVRESSSLLRGGKSMDHSNDTQGKRCETNGSQMEGNKESSLFCKRKESNYQSALHMSDQRCYFERLVYECRHL